MVKYINLNGYFFFYFKNYIYIKNIYEDALIYEDSVSDVYFEYNEHINEDVLNAKYEFDMSEYIINKENIFEVEIDYFEEIFDNNIIEKGMAE